MKLGLPVPDRAPRRGLAPSRRFPRSAIDFKAFVHQIQSAERAKFDMGFLADNDAFAGGGGDRTIEADLDALSRTSILYTAQFEPITLLSALSAVSDHIGLVSTVSTTYNDPFNVARKFASLDYLSGGRAGWNRRDLVNFNAAQNFSMDHHPERMPSATGAPTSSSMSCWGCGTAGTTTPSCTTRSQALLRSPQGALPGPQGRYYSVRGPLNVPRSPQGRPVVIKPARRNRRRGRAHGRGGLHRPADGRGVRRFSRDLRTRLPRFGRRRNPSRSCRASCCVVADSRAEAEEFYAVFEELIQPEVGLMMLNSTVGLDLSEATALDMRLEPARHRRPARGGRS